MNNSHLQPGTLLSNGRYRIVRFIGAGGFGCTYEAEFVPMRTRVAIKEFFVSTFCNRDATGAISVGTSSQASLVAKLEEKFRREAQRLFGMKHPGIVSVSDMMRENGTSYYAMDYIAGQSLQDLIERFGPLPEAKALKYIGQVMDALEYVHGQNMLHLDIKPDNIMIDANDNAILIDFGVSKQYDEVDGHNTSTIMGQTPGFAPPEQAGNSIRQFTPAADIYALGATLYASLTGETPANCVDLMSGVSTLSPLPQTVSRSTIQAIYAMMQPHVGRRPQSIAEVRRMLTPPVAGVAPAVQTPVRPQVNNVTTGSETQAFHSPVNVRNEGFDNGKNISKVGIGVCLISIFSALTMRNFATYWEVCLLSSILVSIIVVGVLTFMAFKKDWFKQPIGRVCAGIWAVTWLFAICEWMWYGCYAITELWLCLMSLIWIMHLAIGSVFLIKLKTNTIIRVLGVTYTGLWSVTVILWDYARYQGKANHYSYVNWQFYDSLWFVLKYGCVILCIAIIVFSLVWMFRRPVNKRVY